MHSQETNQKPENMLETDAPEADAPISDVKEEAKERATRRSEDISISSILDKRKGEEESLRVNSGMRSNASDAIKALAKRRRCSEKIHVFEFR